MRAAAAFILLIFAAPGARAAPKPEPAPAAPPKTVSSLTVVPGDRAKLVSSFPAADQVVAPGVLVVKLTFDQKMLGTTFDIGPVAGKAMPNCLKVPRLLNDGRTFVLLCTTAPKTSYALAINPAQSGGFENTGEVRAAASTLSFSTSDAQGPVDIADAMKVAGLTDGDEPIADAPEEAETGPAPHAQKSPP